MAQDSDPGDRRIKLSDKPGQEKIADMEKTILSDAITRFESTRKIAQQLM